MRYSTNPGRDLRRVCAWSLVAVVGCYLLVALIPFGIAAEPEVSNRAGLPAADIESLLAEAGVETGVHGFREVYMATLFRPWERMHYRNSIEVEGGSRVYSVTMTSQSPNGRTWIRCKASRKGKGWETWGRQTAMERF